MASNRSRSRGYTGPADELRGIQYQRLSTLHPWTVSSVHYTGSPYLELISDETHQGPPYETGGPMTLLRTKYIHTPTARGVWTRGGGILKYEGDFVSNHFGGPGFSGKPTLPVDDLAMFGMGAKGWNRYKPGKPVLQLGQFLIELRQLPTLPLQQFLRLKNFRSLGSEYLNVEFGWKPFLKDLRDMYYFTENFSKRLEQLRRDNGKGVRREGRVDVTENVSLTETTGLSSIGQPALATQYYFSANSASFKKSVTTTDRTTYWFSGKFRYWIPDIGSTQWTQRARQALMGINPTPSLLYEVMPWSWLFDWFGGLGDALSNLSANAAENLAADYAFVMGHKSQEIQASHTFQMNDQVWLACASTKLMEVKKRTQASPFGFGLTLPDLTARQIAILAALGISRRWQGSHP